MATEHCYLELHNDQANSHKFWEATLEGRALTVRHGPVGAKGRTIHHPPASSEQAARKKYAELYAEKMRKGYQDLTAGQSTAKSAGPKAHTYSITWSVPDAAPVTAEALTSAYKAVLKVVTDLGSPRWQVLAEDGVGGEALHFLSDDSSCWFGFMPKSEWEFLSQTDRQQHEEEGINGWLSPKGFANRGGTLATNGLWADFPVRLLLTVLRSANPSVEVFDDLGLDWKGSGVAAIPRVHEQKFLWMSEWATIRGVLEKHGLLGGLDVMTAAIRRAQPSKPQGVIVI